MTTRKASCSHCFTTKDMDGKPVTHCTGLCNVIVLSIVERFNAMAEKLNAGKSAAKVCVQ